MLVDEFEDHSYNYAAYDDVGQVIGSVRVVPDGPLGLPLEHCVPLNDYRNGKHLAEISRLAVASYHRSKSRLSALLMKAAYQICIANGISHMVADTYNDATAQLYEKMGFECIGGPYLDPEYNCNLPVFTLGLDINKAYTSLMGKRSGLWRFFTSDNENIDHG